MTNQTPLIKISQENKQFLDETNYGTETYDGVLTRIIEFYKKRKKLSKET